MARSEMFQENGSKWKEAGKSILVGGGIIAGILWIIASIAALKV